MSSSKASLKVRLMVQAEAAIDGLLAGEGVPAHATLTDIEQAVLGVRQQLEPGLTRELVAERATEVTRAWPICPECGQKLKAKGKRRRRVVTETGEVTLEREYYHCAPCGSGLFPPG